MADDLTPSRRDKTGKSPDAFRTISEVSEEIDVPQHVLRFWETKFSQIRPLKRGGGRRYYRPEDIDLLRAVRDLLYEEGYTIKGVQKILRSGRGRQDAAGAVRRGMAAKTESKADGHDRHAGQVSQGDTAGGAAAERPAGAGRQAAERPGGAGAQQPAAGAPGAGLSGTQREALREAIAELSALRDILRGGRSGD